MSDDDDDDGPPDPRVEELLEKYTDAIGEFNKAQIEQTTTKREDERERKETEAARVAVEQQLLELQVGARSRARACSHAASLRPSHGDGATARVPRSSTALSRTRSPLSSPMS